MIEAMEQEHAQLYASVLRPVTAFVCELLGEGARATRPGELAFEDLDKLPAEELARAAEWLVEKVDALSSRTRVDPEEEEDGANGDGDDDEAMGDVDLFALAPGGGGLGVNAKWLRHLQERLLGEDGHPRRARPGEDPHALGLVLEWVYGSIVSTAEKGRDGAKRPLGSYLPTASAAFDALVAALQDQAALEERRRGAKQLLAEMLRSRREADELAAKHGAALAPGGSGTAGSGSGDAAAGGADADAAEREQQRLEAALPDDAIVRALRREALLTQAKLRVLQWERAQKERELRTLRTQIRAGEPELDRLKRELEELKHAPRAAAGPDGGFRTAAEAERHRHQLADAAIEGQLEVQTALREQGSRLQALYDRRQRAEYDLAKRENEVKQLNGWRATVESLAERFGDLLAQRAAAAAASASAGASAGGGEAGEGAEGGAAAAAAAGGEGAADGEGGAEGGAAAAGDVETGDGGRAALQAANAQVQINKMR